MFSLLLVAVLSAPTGPTSQDAQRLQELAAYTGLHFVPAREACRVLGKAARTDGSVRGAYSLAGPFGALSATLGLARVLGPKELFQVQRNDSPSAARLDLLLTRQDVPDRAYRLVTEPNLGRANAGVLGCLVLLDRVVPERAAR